jgi:hypothetical protein
MFTRVPNRITFSKKKSILFGDLLNIRKNELCRIEGAGAGVRLSTMRGHLTLWIFDSPAGFSSCAWSMISCGVSLILIRTAISQGHLRTQAVCVTNGH